MGGTASEGFPKGRADGSHHFRSRESSGQAAGGFFLLNFNTDYFFFFCFLPFFFTFSTHSHYSLRQTQTAAAACRGHGRIVRGNTPSQLPTQLYNLFGPRPCSANTNNNNSPHARTHARTIRPMCSHRQQQRWAQRCCYCRAARCCTAPARSWAARASCRRRCSRF